MKESINEGRRLGMATMRSTIGVEHKEGGEGEEGNKGGTAPVNGVGDWL